MDLCNDYEKTFTIEDITFESLIYEKILILKLDEHNDFCSCFTHNPPAMIDFLIIMKFEQDFFIIFYDE